jgi:hypothetical protein
MVERTRKGWHGCNTVILTPPASSPALSLFCPPSAPFFATPCTAVLFLLFACVASWFDIVPAIALHYYCLYVCKMEYEEEIEKKMGHSS